MAYQQTYNFPAAVKGDTYNEVQFIANTKSGVTVTPIDLTGCSIRMWIVTKDTKSTVLDANTSNSKIIINDAAAGKFKVVLGIVSIPVANYLYDIEIKFPSGVIKTWIKGAFFVISDITK